MTAQDENLFVTHGALYLSGDGEPAPVVGDDDVLVTAVGSTGIINTKTFFGFVSVQMQVHSKQPKEWIITPALSTRGEADLFVAPGDRSGLNVSSLDEGMFVTLPSGWWRLEVLAFDQDRVPDSGMIEEPIEQFVIRIWPVT